MKWDALNWRDDRRQDDLHLLIRVVAASICLQIAVTAGTEARIGRIFVTATRARHDGSILDNVCAGPGTYDKQASSM